MNGDTMLLPKTYTILLVVAASLFCHSSAELPRTADDRPLSAVDSPLKRSVNTSEVDEDRPVVVNGFSVIDRADERFSYLARIVLTILGQSGQCTGSLISSRVVLTAGHCIVYKSFFKIFRIKFSAWEVVLGDLSSRTAGEQDEQKISGRGVAHPLYPVYSFPLDKVIGAVDPTDIGIIKLDSDAKLSPRVTIGNLPSSTAFVPTLGSNATVAGWGVSVSGGDSASDTLLFGIVRVSTDPNSCNPKKTSKQICFDAVNTSNQSACSGDSGGPVMQSIDGRVTIIATVSYGNPSCPVSEAWGAVAVAPHLDWIRKYIS